MDYFTESQISDCRYFIPVYCYDGGVKQVIEHPEEVLQFNIYTAQQVDKLRGRLRKLSSDLLIISGASDKIIPSLARVLQTEEVYTVLHSEIGNNNRQAPVIQFFEKRIEKTKELLNMHSINMHVSKMATKRDYQVPAGTFPPFPEIEPGTIPAELLG